MNKSTDILKSIATYLFILIFSAFFFIPLFWMVVISIKNPIDQFTLGFIPWLQFEPTLLNWENEGILQASENLKALTNSTIIGIGSATIATLLGLIAGYALARYEFKRVKNVDFLSYFLSLRFLPPIAMAIPFYVFMQSIPIPGTNSGLIDNQLAVILMHGSAFVPYAVLVMRDAFRSLPVSMEESAFVDGASILKVLRLIALPLVAPAIAAVFILTFSFSWNEFLFAFILTANKAVTLPIRIAESVTAIGVFFYALSIRQLIAVIPPIILGLLVQKYIVSGLTMGAVKA
jgi:multiple sugar transport system permease protein